MTSDDVARKLRFSKAYHFAAVGFGKDGSLQARVETAEQASKIPNEFEGEPVTCQVIGFVKS